MIRAMPGVQLESFLRASFSSAIEEWSDDALWIKPQSMLEICLFLKDTPNLEFDLLNSISGVDYVEYFEVVYHITSTTLMHSAILKSKVYGREHLSVPSVVSVWQGADFQEREIWDLLGVEFDGHPNLKRIMLWEGYVGHPLRKDYLEPPR